MKSTSPDSDQTLSLFFLFSHDTCTVSCSVGGFFKRGYRTHISTAPLRETLAAAVAYSTLHTLPAGVPYRVVDPFCGTGTLLQEWFSFTHNDSPACQRRRLLPGYKEVWSVESERGNSKWESHRDYPLLGYDASEKAIRGAVHNTQRLIGSESLAPFQFAACSFHQFQERVEKEKPWVILSNVEAEVMRDG